MSDIAVPRSASRTDVPHRSEAASWREVAGQMIVLDMTGAMVRGLNATGGRVWALLDGRATVEQIARVLVNETGVDESTAVHDVTAFVSRLHAMGLVGFADPG